MAATAAVELAPLAGVAGVELAPEAGVAGVALAPEDGVAALVEFEPPPPPQAAKRRAREAVATAERLAVIFIFWIPRRAMGAADRGDDFSRQFNDLLRRYRNVTRQFLCWIQRENIALRRFCAT
ncbi:hypothetical protein ACMX25_12400 [Caballeronia sp. 15715]|uniref:hypothetical protein n=1 Tax=Caballeronia sp. 15715 TaxID=3391030 RepID=UPI0039E594B1